MLDAGIITRFGVVVKHRAFGYRANAMAVWDIADARVDAVAEIFAREPAVTLCYRRPRRPPGLALQSVLHDPCDHARQRHGCD
jgi:DNA-binding Lrp family transcriptional regulator